MKRRRFIINSGKAGVAVSFLGMYACKEGASKKGNTIGSDAATKAFTPFFKLSLAQWSVHKMIGEEKLSPMDFAQKAKEWGFEGLEYVSQLYNKEIEKRGNTPEAIMEIMTELKQKSEAYGMTNQIMMVDLLDENSLLSTPDEEKRKTGVESHKTWVDATALLGCHSMRINLFGSMDEEEWKASSVKSLSELSDYAATKNVNIIVENHGYLSSNAALLANVIKTVDKENCGTLPDFGNFCLRREGNELWGTPCVEEYDKYKGVEELMPYAKGVSAKSFNFDENGNETTIDFLRMMKIVKGSGYAGYVGVEYEGEELSEEKGILATKALLIDVAKKLNN